MPDLTVDECYDDVLGDVEYILHIASSLPVPENGDLLTPAVKGTISILQSALKAPSIRKVVITSSVVSFIPLGSARDGIHIKGDREPLVCFSCTLTTLQKVTTLI